MLLLLSVPLFAYADQYQNFADLASHQIENEDFRIVVRDQKSPITAFAIHGGTIESGTSELASLFSRGLSNLYLFEGLKKFPHDVLHLTSTHFDEPQALNLARQSELCVSFHSYWQPSEPAVCIGGGNLRIAQSIAQSLSALSWLRVYFPCEKFRGVEPANIVNRCAQQGLQFEFSTALMQAAVRKPYLRVRIVERVKAGLRASMHQGPRR